jgi:hypothetical protein
VPPRYIRPYVKRNRTDAAALLEALRCADIALARGSLCRAPRSALRWRRFQFGTGHYEPTPDAGYTTAGVTPTAITPDHASDLREESICA